MSAVAIEEKRKIGRPTMCTDEICKEIIERYEEGEPLAMICESPHIPSRVTLWRWMDQRPEFSSKLIRARTKHAYSIMEKTLARAMRATDKDEAACAKVQSMVATQFARAFDRDTWGAKEEREITHYQRMDDNALRAKLLEKITSDPAILEAVQAVIASRSAKQLTGTHLNGDASQRTVINGDASPPAACDPRSAAHGQVAQAHAAGAAGIAQRTEDGGAPPTDRGAEGGMPSPLSGPPLREADFSDFGGG